MFYLVDADAGIRQKRRAQLLRQVRWAIPYLAQRTWRGGGWWEAGGRVRPRRVGL